MDRIVDFNEEKEKTNYKPINGMMEKMTLLG
jgi:hypothetical protein